MNAVGLSARVLVARTVAENLLDRLPQRWAHTVGVARRAAELARTVEPGERDVLVVSAWLHDIGYSPTVEASGFHPLDGADYLSDHGWPGRICELVAHHSGARFVAHVRDLGGELRRYRYEQSPTSDALTYADQTTGFHGESLSIEERMAEMLARHGPDSHQARVHHHRAPFLRAVGRRVEQRLHDTGVVEAFTLASG